MPLNKVSDTRLYEKICSYFILKRFLLKPFGKCIFGGELQKEANNLILKFLRAPSIIMKSASIPLSNASSATFIAL